MPASQSAKTISFRIDPDKVATLDSIAANMDRDRSYLLNEAVASYLEDHAHFAALVEEGLQASRESRLVDHEDVMRLADSGSVERSAEKAREHEPVESV